MFLKRPIVFVITLFLFLQSHSQDIKFLPVSMSDFNFSRENIDTTQGAIVISEVGSGTIEGTKFSSYAFFYRVHRRILILSKNGLNLANVQLFLSRSLSGNEEKVVKLKATTYNIENGNIVETDLKEEDIFTTNFDKLHRVERFTMPNVKDGSVIDYSYTLRSDYITQIKPWYFQSRYPKLWSEYSINAPQRFQIRFLTQGNLEFNTDSAYRYYRDYDDTYILGNKWIIKNVQPLTEEKFTSSLENHLEQISFQFSGGMTGNGQYIDLSGNWGVLNGHLMKDNDFGGALNNANPWLNDAVNSVTKDITDTLQKAKAIFNYVKNNIKCIQEVKTIWLSQPLKEVFKTKKGTVADVNMLLTAMLMHENINANPLILSTRDNGWAHAVYPLIANYNYVISKVRISNKVYFLDATQPEIGFNRLPTELFNGDGMMLGKHPEITTLSADMLNETKDTHILLFANENNPGTWDGNFDTHLSYFESTKARKIINTKGKKVYEKSLENTDLLYSGFEYEKLDSLDDPFTIHCNLSTVNNNGADIIYFNPMTTETLTKNPFESEARNYPVEMPFKIDQKYFLSIEIPKGFTVDELPKPTKAFLNNNDGIFEYNISKDENEISLRCHIKLEKANFSTEDYDALRNFYGLIVKTESEQIVFKKKK